MAGLCRQGASPKNFSAKKNMYISIYILSLGCRTIIITGRRIAHQNFTFFGACLRMSPKKFFFLTGQSNSVQSAHKDDTIVIVG